MRERIASVSNTFQMFLVNSGALNSMMKLFEGLVSIITGFVLPVFSFMVKVVSTAVSIFGKLADVVLPVLLSIFERLTTNLKDIFGPVIGKISNAINGVSLKFEDFKGAIDLVDKLMVMAFGVISSVVYGASTAFESIWAAAVDLLDPLEKLWSSVTNLFGAVYDLFGSTKSLETIFLEVGQVIGEVFSILGFITKSVISGLSILYNSVADVIRNSEFLKNTIETLSQVISESWRIFRKYFSIDGFKTIFENIGEAFDELGDGLMRWLNKLTLGAVGITENEYKARAEAREQRKKERDDKLEANLAEKDERNRNTQALIDQQKNDLKEKGLYNRANQIVAQRELAARETAAKAAEKAKELELGDPYALLKGLAEKEGSEFVNPTSRGTPSTPSSSTSGSSNTAEGDRRTMEAEAEHRRAQEQRAREEQQRQQQQQQQQPTTPPATSPSTQEVLIASINRLNTNMERMVAQQSRSNTLLTNQVRATENVAGAVSGDLFGALGA